LDQKTSNSKVTPLEVRRIEGLNPYQVSVQKLDALKNLQEWTLSLQSIDQKKKISQISIRELSELPQDHQFSLWKDQLMILKAPCLLPSAPMQFENLDIELDPFSLDQVLIRWAATASGQASFQFQCLDRDFRFEVQASRTAQEHTSYLAVPLQAGKLMQKKTSSTPQKTLEKELGLDLEEGR
jgi:hypothetical protein